MTAGAVLLMLLGLGPDSQKQSSDAATHACLVRFWVAPSAEEAEQMMKRKKLNKLPHNKGRKAQYILRHAPDLILP